VREPSALAETALPKCGAGVELVEPLRVASPEAGPRFMLTILVEDVDAIFRQLSGRGVAFLNGPVDRAWGRRTAAFADPSGNLWEIAHKLAQ
jgi:catechol 2,3-dioxygenase-like lactoylglutathione lyase family enzyme